VSGSPKY